MIDKRPALIARCADADDVATAVGFAAEQGPAVRGARRRPQRRRHRRRRRRHRHRPLGDARRARSTPAAAPCTCRAARPGPTSTASPRRSGSPRPGGVVSETGVAGLALSGGVSLPAPRARDDRRQPRLGRGRPRRRPPRARERRRAPRPATGRCAAAAATSASSRRSSCACTRSGPEVFDLVVAYPIEDAARVLAGWRDAVAGAPDELSTVGFIWSLPVVPDLPEHLRGRPYVGVAGMWAGDPAEGERAPRPLRELATPLLDMSGTSPYVEMQQRARRVLPGRPPLLLEGALPRRDARRRDRRRPSTGAAPPLGAHARGDPPLRRRDGARGRRGDGVRRPQRGVDAEHRRDLGRPGRRRGQHRLDARVLGRRPPLLPARQDLLQLPRPARGGRRGGARELRRQPRPAGADQGRVRPRQPLPAQPEHPPRGRVERPIARPAPAGGRRLPVGRRATCSR